MVLTEVTVLQYAGRYQVSDLNELLALSDLNGSRCQLDSIARRMFNTVEVPAGLSCLAPSLLGRPSTLCKVSSRPGCLYAAGRPVAGDLTGFIAARAGRPAGAVACWEL